MRKQTHLPFTVLLILSMLFFAATACGSQATAPTPTAVQHEHEEHTHEQEHEHEMPSLSPVSLGAGEKLKVVATTSIVHDVVSNIGDDLIELTMLMPLGTDPHGFEPTPQDVAAVADAHVVFANGAGLEEFLDPLLESAGAMEKSIHVSHGIELLQPEGEHEEEKGREEGREHEGEHHHHSGDPHTWTDPTNVMVWVHNIEHTLSTLDPNNAEAYETNAEAYESKLKELDAWVREQVGQIPEADRQIVTDHVLFAYFADEYGFTQVGAVVAGYSTLAEPSAKDLAKLEDAIHELGVKAVFVGNTVNPGLAETAAEDTGTELVFIYTGSLTEKGGNASTYLDYMRYNVTAFVSALQ